MSRFRQLFFPTQAPTEEDLRSGRRGFVAEGAVAAVIYSIGTGNFLAGYLSYLGASVSFCAVVAMIPTFGCVLQFFSPLLFERLRYRKLAVWLLCVLFRFPLGLMLLVPLAVPQARYALPIVLALYTVGFLSAGLVTPGLQNMTLGLAPPGMRGRYLAIKDIAATCVNSVATLLLGRQLDWFTAQGRTYDGYLVIGIVCLVLAAVDAVLLAHVRENPASGVAHPHLQDVFVPLRDKSYRPVLLYAVLGGLANGVASPFLSVYELRVLGLSHTFITTVGVFSAGAGMLGSWLWGRLADKTTWVLVARCTAALGLCCTFGWSLVQPGTARLIAPVLMIGAAACSGGLSIANTNLQFESGSAGAKTAYLGVTSALTSIIACVSAAVSTAVQPMLEPTLGEGGSIAVLFAVAGAGGFANLFFNGRRLPNV